MSVRDSLWAWLGWMSVFPGIWRNCRIFGAVQTSYTATEKELWLTIDDGPDPLQTPAVLDVLKSSGVRATFFVIGRKVRAHPDLCRRMIEEGHSVQNHTESHPAGTFWATLPARARREIQGCSEAIFQTTGCRPREFRAPVGMANPFVHFVSKEMGLRIVGWYATGHDGVFHDPTSQIHKIQHAAQPGGIVLVHESHLLGMREGERACTLLKLLNTLKEDGYSFRNNV